MTPEPTGDTPGMEWHDPPDAVEETWRAAEDRIVNGHLPPSCPADDGGTLRYFFIRHDPPEPVGGLWVWCSICRSFAHYRARVPGWWVDVPEVPLDERLEHNPGWLDENWRDDWLTRQPLINP
jgi:hypothetical protein